MPSYQARYVHKISPSAKDIAPDPVVLTLEDLSSRTKLAAALRRARILSHGGRVDSYRIENDRVVVFPQKSIWHSIIFSLQA
jgi:hypothetical protein